ncbi:MAG: HAD family hydrolase [Thermoplasmata archaeon]|nr:HAD hydrolase-like protein [Euryarchaeota archaeon]RLF64370.1 MAG: HAD family hydrolase [Thermoplasmata archaeon]
MIIAFDFDGTLIDSYYCIEEAFYRAFNDYKFLPFKRLLAKFLTYIELQFERPKFGRHRFHREIYFTNSKLWRRWLEERAALSRPIENAILVINELKSRGHTIISFSAEDFVPGMKKYRLERSPFYTMFDDIIIFGRGKSIDDAMKYVKEKHGTPIVWVDDKPWRFLRLKDREDVIFIWYTFEKTKRFVTNRILERLHELDNFYIVQDLKEVLKIVSSLGE